MEGINIPSKYLHSLDICSDFPVWSCPLLLFFSVSSRGDECVLMHPEWWKAALKLAVALIKAITHFDGKYSETWWHWGFHRSSDASGFCLIKTWVQYLFIHSFLSLTCVWRRTWAQCVCCFSFLCIMKKIIIRHCSQRMCWGRETEIKLISWNCSNSLSHILFTSCAAGGTDTCLVSFSASRPLGVCFLVLSLFWSCQLCCIVAFEYTKPYYLEYQFQGEWILAQGNKCNKITQLPPLSAVGNNMVLFCFWEQSI